MAFAFSTPQNVPGQPVIRTAAMLRLDNGAQAQIVSFKNLSDNKEHVALVFPGTPEDTPPLVRLHSQCLTGDVFHSAQCDCGNQINEAIERMGAEGGILLYLAQEGRGIGLYNKIDAYELQKRLGLDTYAANRHLGFEEDERCFKAAAEMLFALGVDTIRLLTGNPEKVSALKIDGITIVDVIPTGLYEKDANRQYLKAKKKKGHVF